MSQDLKIISAPRSCIAVIGEGTEREIGAVYRGSTLLRRASKASNILELAFSSVGSAQYSATGGWETVNEVSARVSGFFRHYVLRWANYATRLAREHGLDPRVFIFLYLLGYAIQAAFYLPWLKSRDVHLALLISLRILGLVGPLYVLLKGRKIAAVLNLSLALSWSLNTAWHVCYYVYL